MERRSGATRDDWQFVFGETHALGQDDAEAVEKCGLSGIGLGDAAKTNLPVRCGRQHDIVRLNTGEFFEQRARRVSETSALLPHLETLPEHEGEEAHKDVGLQAIGPLVPYRPHVQLIFLDTKRGFRLRELDIGLPQLFIAPIGNVGAQQIGALRERRPVIE